MTAKIPAVKTGYTRREFNSLFQVYSAQVYTGLFRDFSVIEARNGYYLAFREEAGKDPLITIEKRILGPERVLFIGYTIGFKGKSLEIARSEKLESFIAQLQDFIEKVKLSRCDNVKQLFG